MYQQKSRVRYSESGENGCLTLKGIINYLQDCSTFQSEDSGVGVKFLTEHGKAWLLSSWRIRINRYPEFAETITVGTWPYGTKGIYGYRNFVIQEESGKRLVEADSTWFMVSTENGLPIRVSEADIAPYGEPQPAIPFPEAPRKILLPKEYVTGSPVTVGMQHIDTNHHVNNACYVEIAREAAGETGEVEELRVDYKKAAVLGDLIIPRISRNQKELTVALTGADETCFAVVWSRAH